MANIILALDGEAIIMKNLRITLGMQYQDKDQSGQTSSTTHAEQGIKAKELQVNGSAAAKQGGSSSDGGATAGAKESDQQLTWFEKTVLKPVNDTLGKVVD